MAAEPLTARSLAKAERRSVLLTAAAGLFAARGYNGVSMEDLGAAAGVSGPAVYRHFPGKQALLGALLVGVSEDLLHGGQAVVDANADPGRCLRALIGFHVDFAVKKPDVIRVQDRDFDSLGTADRAAVRQLQRRYVELWVQVLGRLFPDRPAAVRRLQAQATFGLINSTPHSAPLHRQQPAAAREVLASMAWAGLTSLESLQGQDHRRVGQHGTDLGQEE
ncbi:TetR/AcrR family transcriptional regulator [Specibacter sp. NPDC057265]|uniref:SACE_7040 family transcriptional regulator n=1 Tax=Specibacter sp. NPDC057265 TaxID=3346075 RepID=UPI003639A3D6